jgi:hypothetical protein
MPTDRVPKALKGVLAISVAEGVLPNIHHWKSVLVGTLVDSSFRLGQVVDVLPLLVPGVHEHGAMIYTKGTEGLLIHLLTFEDR